MTQNTEVEIIPWAHSPYLLTHEDVVKYVKKLPKNSCLAMEIPPDNIVLLERLKEFIIATGDTKVADEFIERVWGKGLERLPEYGRRRFLSQPWATLEIVHECWKKNITIIPIETPLTARQGQKAILGVIGGLGAPEGEVKMPKGVFGRERGFVRQIQTTLRKFKGKKLPVLMGPAHSLTVKRELENSGINATINTQIFTKKRKMEKIVNRGGKLAEAVMRGEPGRLLWQSIRIEMVGKNKRKEPLPKVKERMVEEMCKKAEHSKIKLLDRAVKERLRKAGRQKKDLAAIWKKRARKTRR